MKNKTTFTPGPWYKANNANDTQGLVVAEGSGANIAVTYAPEDAALISAAPDMLAALKGVFVSLTHGKVYPADIHYCINVCAAAIAKAKGG